MNSTKLILSPPFYTVCSVKNTLVNSDEIQFYSAMFDEILSIEEPTVSSFKSIPKILKLIFPFTNFNSLPFFVYDIIASRKSQCGLPFTMGKANSLIILKELLEMPFSETVHALPEDIIHTLNRFNYKYDTNSKGKVYPEWKIKTIVVIIGLFGKTQLS